jgi:hypothetical protein
MNSTEKKIINIFHNSNNYNNKILDNINNIIRNNDIYKHSDNLKDYNLKDPIDRFSTPIQILHKHLVNSKSELDFSKKIYNNIIPIKKK